MRANSEIPRQTISAPRWLDGLWLAVRLGLGLAFLYVSFAQVDWAQLGSNLAAARPDWLGLAVVSVLISTALKIVRWRLLIHLCAPASLPGWARLSAAFLVGQAANVVLPFRGGDLVRIGWLAVQDREDALPVTLSIVLEKFVDILALFMVLAWLGPILPLPVLERVRGWLVPLGAGFSILLILAVGFAPFLWCRLREWPLLHRLAAAQAWLARMDAWVAAVRQPGALRSWLPIAAMTAGIWLVMLATNLCVLRALNLPTDIRAGGLVLALVMVGLAPALMPGNFGPFYFFAMLGLAPFGIAEAAQAAFAVLLHAVVTLPPLALAAGFIAGSRRRHARAP
jgi:hypothetical protein